MIFGQYKHRCNTLPAKDLSRISQIFTSDSEYVVMSPSKIPDETKDKSKIATIAESLYMPMSSVISLKNKIENCYMIMNGKKQIFLLIRSKHICYIITLNYEIAQYLISTMLSRQDCVNNEIDEIGENYRCTCCTSKCLASCLLLLLLLLRINALFARARGTNFDCLWLFKIITFS